MIDVSRIRGFLNSASKWLLWTDQESILITFTGWKDNDSSLKGIFFSVFFFVANCRVTGDSKSCTTTFAIQEAGTLVKKGASINDVNQEGEGREIQD